MDENIMKVKVGGKTGAVTRAGRVLIEPVVDSISTFVDGKALVLNRFQDEYFLMGILGEDESVRKPADIYYVRDYPFFSEGLLPVYDSRGYYGYIDGNGNPIVPFKFMNIHPFCQGYAAVSRARPELLAKVTDGIKVLGMNGVMYIDKKGNELKLDKMVGTIDMGTSFYDGSAVVQQRKGGSFCSIGLDGKLIEMNISPVLRFDWKFRLSNEEFPERVSSFIEDGPVSFYEGGLIGYREGEKVLVPPQFIQARSFSGGYALASSLYGYYGLLELIPEGFVTCSQERGSVDPGSGKETVTFQLTMPEAFRNMDWKVRCQSDGQNLEETYLYANGSVRRAATFILAPKPRTVDVSVDGIVLFRRSYSVLEPEAKMGVSVVATARRANARDNFTFNVVITNPGRRPVNVPVSVTGTGLVFEDQIVTIPAGGKVTLGGYFTRVTRTQTRKVTITCGDMTVSKSLTVKPIVGD